MKLRYLRAAFLFRALIWVVAAQGQGLYQYQNEAGEWVFTDRPAKDILTEVIVRPAPWEPPTLNVESIQEAEETRIVAHNRYVSPLWIDFELIGNNIRTLPIDRRRWQVVLPAKSRQSVQRLQPVNPFEPWQYQVSHRYSIGDPKAIHQDSYLYRAPFASGSEFLITQAYPDELTHSNRSSHYAIDFAMPIGTPVHAAREGTVLDVTYKHYQGGIDVSDFDKANVIHIFHDDGTFASYVHLHWDSVRVFPGERVQRGQYIADSGNTGFTTGPHLHFVVSKNSAAGRQSVPIQFSDESGQALTPQSGVTLRVSELVKSRKQPRQYSP